MKSAKVLVPLATLVLGGVVGVTALVASRSKSQVGIYQSAPINPSSSGTAGGMMGGGADIANGAAGGLVLASRMQALAVSAAHSASKNGNHLTYHSSQVELVALGAPGNKPGMYWQIDGVDNPIVSVRAGSSITVDFADGDPGHPHGFELTTAAPPFGRMAMMAGNIASLGAFIMPVPPPQGNQWYAVNVTFLAPQPGTYYIICPVPGHAQQGMWTKFIVS